ncbi:MAG: radical SAM/SPASM domain-containing protein [Promethearchaeota archaeon]
MSSFIYKNYLLIIYNKLINYFCKIPNLKYLRSIIARKIRIVFIYRNLVKKILRQIDNIQFPIKFDKQKYPIWAGIEITNICNLNCIMCNTQLSKRSRGYMKPEVFKNVLNELKTIGINRIAIHTLGEPFMYNNLDILFELIKKYKFKVYLSTNGQFPGKIKNLIYKYSNSIEFIRFSIDGAKSDTYEKIRRGATFDKLIQSLEVVHKFNESKIDFRIPIRIDSILSLTNLYEVLLFFTVFKKYCKPESINFNIVSGLSPDNSYFREAFPFPNLIRKRIPCRDPFYAVHFTYHGEVTLCCEDFNGELIIGDLKKNSLIEIWNGKNSRFIRKQHLNPEELNINACKNCYEPYSFISDITNKFIHYLYYYYHNISEQQFGRILLAMFKDMDKIMINKDKDRLKSMILKFFIKDKAKIIKK